MKQNHSPRPINHKNTRNKGGKIVNPSKPYRLPAALSNVKDTLDIIIGLIP